MGAGVDAICLRCPIASTSHRININITARNSISPHHITSASHHKQPAAQASPFLVVAGWAQGKGPEITPGPDQAA